MIELITLVIVLASFILLLSILVQLRKANETLERINGLTQENRARQSQITSQVGIVHKNPQIDAKARTTKRDTNDLDTRGGRMIRSTKRYRVASDDFDA